MGKRTWSLLLWCLICLAVICTFLPALMVDRNSPFFGNREEILMLTRDWRIGFSAHPPAERDWLPLDTELKESLSGYEGTVWLERELPAIPFRSPYLFVSRFNRFEVYLDGQPIYAFNAGSEPRWYIHAMNLIHPIEIGPQDEGKTLTVRTEWEGQSWFADDQFIISEMDQLMNVLLQLELASLIYSLVCLIAGIVGLAMLARSRDPLYGWFSLFGVAMSLAMLFNCRSLQWMVDFKEMYYWNQLMTPVVVFACVGFYRRALGGWRWRMLGWTQLVMALYVLLAAVVAVASPYLFKKYLIFEGHALMAFAAFAAVSFAMVGSSRWTAKLGAREEHRWLVRSYWTFTLSAVTALGLYAWPSLLNRLMVESYYLYRVIEGLLLFMISMVMVTVSRISRVYREAEQHARDLEAKHAELEQFHRNLEAIVEKRTAELEQANRTLAVTMQEKAETLAEMSVMQERSRIASEIHDVVGHTLTAAIVQLEATKRVTGQGQVPLDKLELIGSLVRKGLDDIRRAVRMMQADEVQTLSFEESLRDLILYTEDSMEVVIDWDVDLPPDVPIGKSVETVIYHALQEGLTNGIRHGQSKYFRFALRCQDGTLHFLLENDGLPYEQTTPGFGLSSMMGKVRQLGGEVSISASAAPDGHPAGCVLALHVPIQATD